MVELPGTVNEDGKVYNYSAGGGTGCAITKLSKSSVAGAIIGKAYYTGAINLEDAVKIAGLQEGSI
mgnify:CR=1 FL=1